MNRLHVIGGGVAGLACAVRAALAGAQVALYEGAGHAGGRCRSFKDDVLGCTIDNGSHLMLSAYGATLAYLSDIGARERITEIAPAAFPFVDLRDGRRWRVQPGAGRLPLWLLAPHRRVPGSSVLDYLKVLRLARARPDATVADVLGTGGSLYELLWQPLCRAALNTDPREASARLFWAVVSETLLKGEPACRPILFLHGLSPALVDPALALLAAHRAEVRFQARLRGLEWRGGRVVGLRFPEGTLRVAHEDKVVLAVPPDACAELWPEASIPTGSRAIVNAHFRLAEPAELPWGSPFVGLVGGASEWAFVRDGVLSVTISAAEDYVDRPAHDLANTLWVEMARLLGRSAGQVPPWRVIKEKRATFAQTPADAARRAGATTSLENLFVAGDWTETGLPATIESAVRAGFRAAELALHGREASA